MQIKEISTEGFGIAVNNFYAIQSQIDKISKQLANLAKKDNKTQNECVDFFKSKGINLSLSDFTPQYLIGFSYIQIELLKKAIEVENRMDIFNITFHLGQSIGIIQSMLVDGKKEAELFKIFKSQQAITNANKKHLETYELKNQAIEYWKQNIDPKLSNDKAATILEKVVPLSHRKLSEYVSEAKKQNIPPASKK